jgi:type IV pilus assembly protein PilB
LKTLAEIAIDAGLVNKADVARAGRTAEERKQPLVVALIRELGVDEVALVGAIRKQMRVQIIDPAGIQVDPEALRVLPRDVCSRLRVLPLSVTPDGSTKLLRLAMADPTDTAAVAEVEQLTHCDIDVSALPLSAIEELVDKGYKQVNTVVTRPGGRVERTIAIGIPRPITGDEPSEVSVTAQIPLSALQAVGESDLELRLNALTQVLLGKGLITEADLSDALRKLKGDGSS